MSGVKMTDSPQCQHGDDHGIRQLATSGRPSDKGPQEEQLRLLSDSSESDDEMETATPNGFETPPIPQTPGKAAANGAACKVKGPPTADKEARDVETRCGYWQCRPDILQKGNNPNALLMFLCLFSMAQGFAVNGINNVNTTSVERRFQLASSQVGMVSSSYDFSAAILGVFISYMGSGRHKAIWLTLAAVVMAIGSFVMAVPHFTSGKYEWGQNVTLACRQDDGVATTCSRDGDLQNYLYVLVLGQMLHGLGGTTLYTVGIALIDDSVSATSSPLYIGIMYSFAALGPALGYIAGGQLLQVYVDFDTVPSSHVHISPEDPRWVGAWWVGFVIASGLFLLSAIPISLYGAELPSAQHVRETRVSQMHGDDGSVPVAVPADTRGLRKLKQLPLALWELMKVPPFVFITFGGAAEGLLTSGFATFMPKFIENQYGVTAGWASMLTGFVAVPGAAGGQFFGGYLSKKMGLKVKGCLRVAIVCCSVTVLVTAVLLVTCDETPLAGVMEPYKNSSGSPLLSLTSACNENCRCETDLYEPVCDTSGTQYFSPCHAGCTTLSADGQSYNSCSCVLPTTSPSTVSPSSTADPGGGGSVTVGKCPSSCKSLYFFLPIIFVAIFLIFVPAPPVVSATLRCVHDSQRALGLGLKMAVVRLLGSVPGPILFGGIIDSTCVVWQDKCGEHAGCWVYNNSNMSRNFFILVVGVKIMSVIFFVIAHQLYRPPTEKDVEFSVDASASELVSSVTAGLPDIDRETVL